MISVISQALVSGVSQGWYKMTSVSVEDLQSAIEEQLRAYGDIIYEATEVGLERAEKILIEALKAASPEDSREFIKSWKSKGKKYKLKRYVGNTKTVQGKKSDIPLSNILEYSSKSKHQGFIKKTDEKAADKMAAGIVAEIKKEA